MVTEWNMAVTLSEFVAVCYGSHGPFSSSSVRMS